MWNVAGFSFYKNLSVYKTWLKQEKSYEMAHHLHVVSIIHTYCTYQTGGCTQQRYNNGNCSHLSKWVRLHAELEYWLDVRGSMHHSIIHKEKSNKMQQCIKSLLFYIYIWSSICFGWHTAHHQEPKTALAASVFHTWKLFGHVVQHIQQPSTYEKPEAASAILGSWWWAVCHLKHVELHINME
jgi:hypothetical protein